MQRALDAEEQLHKNEGSLSAEEEATLTVCLLACLRCVRLRLRLRV